MASVRLARMVPSMDAGATIGSACVPAGVGDGVGDAGNVGVAVGMGTSAFVGSLTGVLVATGLVLGIVELIKPIGADRVGIGALPVTSVTVNVLLSCNRRARLRMAVRLLFGARAIDAGALIEGELSWPE